jgi:hypothetical protein
MTGGGAVVRIDGTSAADQIVISASDDNINLLIVTINGVQEGTFDRLTPAVIQVFGGDGDDTIKILADDGGLDATNGGGSYLPSGVYAIDGEGGTNNHLTIAGVGDMQLQSGGHFKYFGRLGLLDVTFNQAGMNVTNDVISSDAAKAAAALAQLSAWSKTIGPALKGKIGGFGKSMGDLLNGVNARNETPKSDPDEKDENAPAPLAAAAEEEEEGEEAEGEEGADKDIFADAGTEFLRRIFQEGVGGFDLGEIGGPNGIENLEQLRDRLNALDDDPTTTTTLTTDANGKPVIDFQVVKDLGGSAGFDVELADGLISLAGLASLDAEVRVHLRFGIDNNGFYIAAEQNTDPEIVISDIHGTIEGDGRVGFIRVELEDGEFEMDKDVKLSINLHDPGTGAGADGLIRLDELTGLSNDLLTVSVKGDSADGLNDDIHFHGQLAVDFFEIDLPNLDVDLKWANAEQVDNITFTVGPALQSLMDIDANQFIDTVLGAAQQLRQATGVDIFAQKIPLLGKSINDMLDGTGDRIIR